MFGGDAFRYGVEANRPTLEALLGHLTRQHFIRDGITVDEPFLAVRETAGT